MFRKVANLRAEPGSPASNQFSVEYIQELGFGTAQLVNTVLLPSSFLLLIRLVGERKCYLSRLYSADEGLLEISPNTSI